MFLLQDCDGPIMGHASIIHMRVYGNHTAISSSLTLSDTSKSLFLDAIEIVMSNVTLRINDMVDSVRWTLLGRDEK